MNGSRILFVLLLWVIVVNTKDEEVEELVRRAEDEMDGELLKAMVAGAQTPRFRGKKFTRVSRAMSRRNTLYRKIKRLLSQKGLSGEAMERRVSLAIGTRKESRINKFLSPGGQGDKTFPATIVNDVCNDTVVVNCRRGSKFRTIDGRCNNLRKGRQLWGSMSIRMRRYLPAIPNLFLIPDYVEFPLKTGSLDNRALKNVNQFGVKRRRCSCRKRDECVGRKLVALPSARLVSNTFHKDGGAEDDTVAHMLTQFGQFLDHDITLTPEEEGEHCCEAQPDESCFAINIPLNDSFYASRGQTCLPFTRSTIFCENGKGQREQLNGITAFIDASNVYGSDEDTNLELRILDGSGKLLVDSDNLLPDVNNAGIRRAGDVRSSEMPGLATLHTLFVREHNRICSLLLSHPDVVNSWTDEDFYQNARRILIAEMQNIVYGEYLPVVMGPEAIRKWKLNVRTGTRYKARTDPSIVNSFATAAYRFGHSMIQGIIEMYTASGVLHKKYPLSENYFNLENYEWNGGAGMEAILNGLLHQKAQKNDRFVTGEVTNKLFPKEMRDFGGDLVARTIQRGRDHGLPSYTAFYNKFTDIENMDCWERAPSHITNDDWNILKTLYIHPHHIDLFVGGLAEKPVKGGLTGPTFNGIKGKQFKALMDGDRFFFTHKGNFSPEGLKNIMDRKLSDIICDNTGIMEVPVDAFHVHSPTNKKDCSDRVSLDVSKFKVYRA